MANENTLLTAWLEAPQSISTHFWWTIKNSVWVVGENSDY